MVTTVRRLSGCFLLTLLIVVFLSSCGARRKTTYSRYPTGNTKPGSVLTDDSDSRNKTVSGSKIERYADVLGVSPKELRNTTLYSFIDDWMGSPHRMGGTRKSGVDCSGFVSMLYSQVYGKNLPRTSRDMGANVKRKYEKSLKEGDLVFFSFGGRNIDHVGVYLHNNKFVHVSTKRGVIISNMHDSWYYKYFVRCGTPKI